MPSLSSNYLVPAILLNPAFILHIINTFVSHVFPPLPRPSASPHPLMESLGPVPGSTLYMDMHADDRLCWRYTAIMVFIQLLAFGRVQDNRVRRKSAKAAKIAERERRREEEEKKAQVANGKAGSKIGLDGIEDPGERLTNGNAVLNGGLSYMNGNAKVVDRKSESESSDSLTETSEEEMFI